MKKILLYIIMIIFMLSFVSCTNNDNNNVKDDKKDEKNTTTIDDTNKEECITKCECEECEECEKCPEVEVKKGTLYVRYVLDNGKRDIIEKVENIDDYILLDLSYEGHRFIGWYLDSEKTERLTISDLHMPTDEEDTIITAYAKWKAVSFVVTFTHNDEIIEYQTVEYGKAATAPTPPVIKYQKFVGWSTEFNKITCDLTVEAIYEKDVKNIIVVLGNWMNDDGTMSATMLKRLGLALEAIEKFDPMYVVLTGGMANTKAGIAEATAMYNYLVSKGVDKSLLIKEDKSLSTEQNAIYTFRLIQDYDFDNLIIVSTIEHFYYYGGLTYFNSAALNNSKIKAKNIKLMIYTNNATA